MSTATQTTHLFAAAAMLPVLVYLCSVSAHVLHAQPSPNAPLGTSSIWAGSPPSANGRSLNADDNKSTMTPRKAASGAPIYELKHGLGVFTIASGTGCYEGAKGQAQARFGVLTADVDLFVPSVLDMLDDDTGATPQDTVFEKVNEDDDVQRRLDFPTNRTDSHQCDIFHRGKKSFNQISVSMERRSSPVNDRGAVQDTSSSYHHHGTFKAKEDWYDGMTGEYSLSCIHHECTMSLTFGIGGSENCENGSCGTSGSMSAFAKGEKGTTSLKLQGTTELAYQGADTSMLVCVENCEDDAGGPAVNTDAEYVETISVRSFDNNIVQVHSSHGTKAPKAAKGAGGTKAPKAAKGAGGTKAPKAGKSAKNSKATSLVNLVQCSTDADCGANQVCEQTANTCEYDCSTVTLLGYPCFDTSDYPVCVAGNIDTLVLLDPASRRYVFQIPPTGFQKVEPTTSELNTCYQSIFGGLSFWIGLEPDGLLDTWESGASVTFEAWGTGEPSYTGSGACAISTNAVWSFQSCGGGSFPALYELS